MTRRQWLLALSVAVIVAAGATLIGLGLLRGAHVAAAVATRGEVVEQVSGPGTVQARVPLTLSARLTSTVTEVAVDVGDTVQPSQLLVVLEARELVARRAAVARQQHSVANQVNAASAAVEKARADLELAHLREVRDADLHAQGFVSQATLDASLAATRAAHALLRSGDATLAARRADQQAVAQELEIARTQLGFTRLVAPMAGVVIQRLVEPGTTVSTGTPILRLVDPGTLWIAMRVDEALVERIAVGQPATIRLRSGTVVPGRVARLAMQSDAATRELEVNVAFEKLPQRFAIDQEAQVRIDVGREQGVVLPAGAVSYDAAGRPAVLQVERGRTRLVPVQLGPASGGEVLVRAGVAEGTVVVADATRASPGMRVQASAPDPASKSAPWNSP